jgi:hypothetical protein
MDRAIAAIFEVHRPGGSGVRAFELLDACSSDAPHAHRTQTAVATPGGGTRWRTSSERLIQANHPAFVPNVMTVVATS